MFQIQGHLLSPAHSKLWKNVTDEIYKKVFSAAECSFLVVSNNDLSSNFQPNL